MATIKFSALVSDIRGKFNGSQFSRNRAGALLQNKCQQRRGATSSQSMARNAFAFLGRFWHTLTSSEQQQNNQSALSYPYTDKYGSVKYYTGYQLLLRSNLNRHYSGLPPIKVVSNVPPAGLSIEITDYFASISGFGQPRWFWAWFVHSGEQDDYDFQFFISPAVSAGIENYTGTWLFAGRETPPNDEYMLEDNAIPYVSTWRIGLAVFSRLVIIHKETGIEVGNFLEKYVIEN